MSHLEAEADIWASFPEEYLRVGNSSWAFLVSFLWFFQILISHGKKIQRLILLLGPFTLDKSLSFLGSASLKCEVEGWTREGVPVSVNKDLRGLNCVSLSYPLSLLFITMAELSATEVSRQDRRALWNPPWASYCLSPECRRETFFGAGTSKHFPLPLF